MVHTKGRVRQLEVHVDFSTITDMATGLYVSKEFEIPAGALIRSSKMIVGDGITALTSLVIGMKDTVDGSVIDADGLHTVILLAALGAGTIHVGAGALVGAQLASDSVVSLDVTGTTPTAGDATILIEYEVQPADATPPNVIVGEI